MTDNNVIKLHRHSDLKTDVGCRRVVRHGHLPDHEIMTGIGPVGVPQPRIRDRDTAADERIRFNPTILPPYARRTKSLDVLIPILHLKSISTGDFDEVLGEDALGKWASRQHPRTEYRGDCLLLELRGPFLTSRAQQNP